MQLRNDGTLDIATATTRKAVKWKNGRWLWSDFVDRCKNKAQRTHETVKEYAAASKDRQSEIKDVGGFVGGYLKDGIRKKGYVQSRSVATLDIDFATADMWDDFTERFDCAALLYSTHKHTPERPRYRLVIPFSRSVTPDEYEPICRWIAGDLGIDKFDDTTYELPRLFYWPSYSADAEYVCEYQDGGFINPDDVLGEYTNPMDSSSWVRSSREREVLRERIGKAEDPLGKKGIVGAFCNAYSIEEAIANFLSDVYAPADTEGRYTYTKGSVAAGLVCYEGKFAYSHHESDPCSQLLCNAFDLVRIHKFGDRDRKSRTEDVTKLPSYKAMAELAENDGLVRAQLLDRRTEAAKDDFAGLEISPDDSGGWKKNIAWNGDNAKSEIANIKAIIDNDPMLKGKIKLNKFTYMPEVSGRLPWQANYERQWTDTEEAGLRSYMEKVYGVTDKRKIEDALLLSIRDNSYHPIRDYLDSLKWDGVKRLDTLIIDYLGAEDTPLNRAVTRKQFTAAVARVFRPGCKYDYCLVLVGTEGAGKSSLLRIMGEPWFSDSVYTTDGKEGAELIRKAWLIELAELSGVRRSDVEQVKAYLSRQEDRYRPAYERNVKEMPRQCVFFGSTNEDKFLKGDTGNRRFWIIKVDTARRTVSGDWKKELGAVKDQLWAEAVEAFKRGEKLYLDDAQEMEVAKIQEEYNIDGNDPYQPLLEEFLSTPLPRGWSMYDLQQRRRYWEDMNPDGDKEAGDVNARGTEARTEFSVCEFLCEKIGLQIKDKDYKFHALRVGRLMDKVFGDRWKKGKTNRHAGRVYGPQKRYVLIDKKEEKEESDGDND